MGRRSEHSREELQALIVQATLELVRQAGAEAVTARKIASAVGYTPGMLYSVFVNQQDIFQHVNAVTLEALYAHCNEAMAGCDEPLQIMLVLAESYLHFAEAHTHQFEMLFRRVPEGEDATPAVVLSRISMLFSLVEAQLAALDPTQEPLPVKLAARALWSGVHGVAALALNDQLYLPDGQASADIVRTQVRHFAAGWVSDAQPPDKTRI